MNKFFLVLFAIACTTWAMGQQLTDGKVLLDNTGNHYLKLSFTSQFWLRSGRYNPGTTIFGFAKEGGSDIGIRRFRMQLFGQLSDRIFFYSQFGLNNFNSISDRKPSFFVHDVSGEYSVIKDKLSLGIGLSGWSGLSRFSSPSVASIMGLDAPLYLQTTNDVTDQFLRKLGLFAKGKIGKLDYRFLAAQPMSIQKSTFYVAEPGQNATFSAKPPHWQWNGYVQLQFLDQESNQTPYMTGTYLGKKRVFNIGAGFQYQAKAMWQAGSVVSDTVFHPLFHVGGDMYYDAPVGVKGAAIHVYGQVSHLDFGPGYLRNLGVMNPSNGDSQKNVLNGGGIAFPAYGTGNVFYMQVGYKFREQLIGNATVMPYFSIQRASYQRLSGPMNYISSGLTVLLNGHKSKLTLAYESRPVFFSDSETISRRGCGILQYQIFY